MPAIPQTVTLAVVILGLVALIVARLPSFRRDFRRSVSTAVAAVALLTLLLSLNVMVTAQSLYATAVNHQLAMINSLLLAGLVLMLVSTLAFFFSLGILIWTMVPDHGRSARLSLPDPTSSAAQPADPYTP